MTLTFVRHGETDWNRARRFQGQVDIPLNAQGRAQAKAVARVLARESFDRVVSSDLSRAMDTARAVTSAVQVSPDPRWREFAFGEWEGLTWEEILVRWPERAQTNPTSARSYAPPGGETFEQVRSRVGDAIDELRRSGAQNALIVTHAGPLHAMLHHVFADPLADTQELLAVRFTPGSITRVRLADDGNELLLLNDVSHL